MEIRNIEVERVVMTGSFAVDYNMDRMIFFHGEKPYRVLLEFDTERMCYPMEAICGKFMDMALDSMLQEVGAFFEAMSRAYAATPECFGFTQEDMDSRKIEIVERIWQQRKCLGMLWMQPINQQEVSDFRA